jgi:hypothetical protein
MTPFPPSGAHGDERTPPTRTEDASEPLEAAEDDYSDERHQLAMVIHDGGCQCRGHTLGWTIRSRDSLQLADAVLAAGYAQGSDIHLVAYASLHETVRRFLAGEANRSYLSKRFEDIEDDLQRAVVAERTARVRGSVSGGGNATT